MDLKEQIVYWKSLYDKIYKIQIGINQYIYRRPNLGEILSIRNTQVSKDEIKLSLYVLNCILYPEDKNSISPGDYSILRDAILKSNPILEDKDIDKNINDARNRVNFYMQDLFFMWKLHVIKTFPGYKFEDLDKLQLPDFLDLVLLVENITGISITNFTINNTNKQAPNGIEKITNTMDEPISRKNPTFLSKEELDRIAIEKSTQELENIYYGCIPKHQTEEQIKNKSWKSVDLPQPIKKKVPIPENTLLKKK